MLITYQLFEKRHAPNDFLRKCIDGRNVGCSNCVGYCSYKEHSGYLTANLRKEHDCLNKKCHYYLKKPQKQKASIDLFSAVDEQFKNIQDNIFEYACMVASKYEGMKFMKISANNLDSYEIGYITISNTYPFDEMAEKISRKTGYNIELKRLKYSFDNVVSLLIA